MHVASEARLWRVGVAPEARLGHLAVAAAARGVVMQEREGAMWLEDTVNGVNMGQARRRDGLPRSPLAPRSLSADVGALGKHPRENPACIRFPVR